MEVQTYSFRAEFQYDAFTFLARLQEKGFGNNVTQFEIDPNITDRCVEFVVNTKDTEALLKATEDLPDIHVIRQTLRPCRIEDNSMERDFTIL